MLMQGTLQTVMYGMQYAAYGAITLLRLGSVHAGYPEKCSVHGILHGQ